MRHLRGQRLADGSLYHHVALFTIFRSNLLQGDGSLNSAFTEQCSWPFVPPCNAKAVFRTVQTKLYGVQSAHQSSSGRQAGKIEQRGPNF